MLMSWRAKTAASAAMIPGRSAPLTDVGALRNPARRGAVDCSARANPASPRSQQIVQHRYGLRLSSFTSPRSRLAAVRARSIKGVAAPASRQRDPAARARAHAAVSVFGSSVRSAPRSCDRAAIAALRIPPRRWCRSGVIGGARGTCAPARRAPDCELRRRQPRCPATVPPLRVPSTALGAGHVD